MGAMSLKRGKPYGPSLTEMQRSLLFSFINNNPGTSCQVLAKRIGITYFQLYGPLSKGLNCSRESHKKILRFIERHCGKEVV